MLVEFKESDIVKINNLLNQMPISCNWLREEIVGVINDCEKKEK